MTFKTISIALTLALAPFAGHAAPYCDALLDPDALPSKYARVAPIHSSAETGWIFTDEMLSEEYAVKSGNLQLVESIVDAFKAQDVPLAIMVAPPRTIVAGQEIVNATAGTGLHDVNAARESFTKLIAQLRDVGAIVPNLAEIATSADDVRNSYYFKRDTHWSGLGAAISAQALSSEIASVAPDLGIIASGDPSIGETTEEEKGSLARIIRDVCETDPAKETFSLVNFPTRDGSLLSDTSLEPGVILLGTSFSNRYKTDFYRVGDALGWALDRDVLNLSASGAGMIGIIEGFVLNGGLARTPDLIVWETPSTESFNSQSNLRQLLGALLASDALQDTLIAKSSTGDVAHIDTTQPDLIVVRTGTTEVIELRVLVTLQNGDQKTIKLRRRDRIPADLRSPIMAASLAGFSDAIASVAIETTSGKDENVSAFELYQSGAQKPSL